MDKYFYEVFENIPRQGPGLNAATRKAYMLIQDKLSDKPEILDIGCGKGVQTLELARLSKGDITAIDTHPYFLDCLRSDSVRLKLDGNIQVQNADMHALPFPEESFDLIWAEGSVFIMGIKSGLLNWKPFLKPGGFLVLTDLVWLKDKRTEELTNYWENEGLNMLSIKEVLEHADQIGFNEISHFTLPIEAWTNEYFDYQTAIIKQLRIKYGQNEAAEDVYTSLEKEMNIVLKYAGTHGYEFFIFQAD